MKQILFKKTIFSPNKKLARFELGEAKRGSARAENRTRGPTMATLDFTTKPLARRLSIGTYVHNV